MLNSKNKEKSTKGKRRIFWKECDYGSVMTRKEQVEKDHADQRILMLKLYMSST